MMASLRNNDLVSVGINYEICIVRDDNNLPSRFGIPKSRHEFIEYGLRIEIFLGLIDDKRPVVVAVD